MIQSYFSSPFVVWYYGTFWPKNKNQDVVLYYSVVKHYVVFWQKNWETWIQVFCFSLVLYFTTLIFQKIARDSLYIYTPARDWGVGVSLVSSVQLCSFSHNSTQNNTTHKKADGKRKLKTENEESQFSLSSKWK